MKILILLAYYNRPKMVRYALESVRRAGQLHSDFELALIDDGSEYPGEPIAHEILGKEFRDKIRSFRYNMTYDEKVAVGESFHGVWLNTAITVSRADLVITLCDDDALKDDYLFNLNQFFTDNPTVLSCYSHVQLYNPLVQTPWESFPTPFEFDPDRKSGRFLNEHTKPINPHCLVDSSQVAWRMVVHTEHKIHFEECQTRDLDAKFYQKLYEKTGLTPFSGFVGQYKGWHTRQLGRRANTYQATWLDPIDIP